MEDFIVEGGVPLVGDVKIDGAKNAVLPIIFATLLLDGVSVIKNVPDIIDVNNALQILADFGANINFSNNTLTIDTRSLNYKRVPLALMSSLRASIYLLGGCLARFGRYELSDIGGCNFDIRPIDMHISSAISLGATLDNGILLSKRLVGNTIVFLKTSVGATVNALLLSASAFGITKIINPAREPHIDTLIEFLKNAGAKIYKDAGRITVIGSSLHGSFITIPPDPIEAGTYLLLGPMTGGEVRVLSHEGLGYAKNKLINMGFTFDIKDGTVALKEDGVRYTEIMTGAYPLFPTDIAPLFAPLLAKYGGGKICEGVWYNRFGYLSELEKFGIKSRRFSHGCEIYKSKIHSADVTACDLRAGAAMLLTSLYAKGQSSIACASLIKRGYSGIDKKLLRLGARIKIIKE